MQTLACSFFLILITFNPVFGNLPADVPDSHHCGAEGFPGPASAQILMLLLGRRLHQGVFLYSLEK